MDQKNGWYKKYSVQRLDGKSDDVYHRGDLYQRADYFVLKLNSGNKYELDALEAYAESCKYDLPRLAYDILKKVTDYRKQFNL